MRIKVPPSLATDSLHPDARPGEPDAPVEVTDGRGREQVRVMSGEVANTLYKRQRRRLKRHLKSIGQRWARRTAKHALRRGGDDP